MIASFAVQTLGTMTSASQEHIERRSLFGRLFAGRHSTPSQTRTPRWKLLVREGGRSFCHTRARSSHSFPDALGLAMATLAVWAITTAWAHDQAPGVEMILAESF